MALFGGSSGHFSGTALVASLCTTSAIRSSEGLILHLHVDSSVSQQCDQPSLPIGSSAHADPSLTIQTHVSHNRSSSAAMGATVAPTAVLPLERHFDIETVEWSL